MFMELWNLLLQHLEQTLDGSFRRAVLSRISFKECQNDKLIVLQAEDSFYAGMFEKNCGPILKEYMNEQGIDKDFRVDISAEPAAPRPAKKSSESVKSSAPAVKESTDTQSKPAVMHGLSPDFTFDSFIPGNCNEVEYKMAKKLSVSNAKYNPIVIIGKVGTGKTHLAQAVAHDFKEKNPNSNIVYVTGEEFVGEFVDYLTHKKPMTSFHKKYRQCDLLIVDDLHHIQGAEQSQKELENVYNALENRGVQMLFTSDRPIDKLKVNSRLRARFKGVPLDLNHPEFETRIAILMDMAQKENHHLDPKIAELIASTVDSDVRDLKSTLMKMFAVSDLKKKEISMKLAKEVLGSKINIEVPHNISIQEVQKIVANYYGIKVSDMKSDSKLKNIAEPRQVAMYISQKYTKNTSTEIGNMFNKSHSTVLRSAEKIKKELPKNTDMKRAIDKILLEMSETH